MAGQGMVTVGLAVWLAGAWCLWGSLCVWRGVVTMGLAGCAYCGAHSRVAGRGVVTVELACVWRGVDTVGLAVCPWPYGQFLFYH